MSVPPAVASFAKSIRELPPVEPLVSFGELKLSASRADIRRLQYNKEPWQLIGCDHEYKLKIGGQDVEVSAQLYENVNDHYRLFLYARAGMLFSVNLTTSEDADGIIWLGQKIAFREGRGKGTAGTRIRAAKARMFADMLVRCGVFVTDDLGVELGTFDGNSGEFLDTSPANFLRQFITIGLVRGHFAGNKGYQFSCLPRFDDSFDWKWDQTEQVREQLRPNRRGARGARQVAVGLRFNVLDRDGGVCCVCGRSPHDGITLHVDHITPFSLGGLTTLDNLQTLCADCNIGKSNRSSTDFR